MYIRDEVTYLSAFIINFVMLGGRCINNQVGDALLKRTLHILLFQALAKHQTHYSLTMPYICCVGVCNNNYDTENEYVKVHRFPSDPDEKQRWINVLINTLPKEPTQDMVPRIKHWPSNYRTCSKKGHQILTEPSSIFSVPSSFAPQTRSEPRKVNGRKIDN